MIIIEYLLHWVMQCIFAAVFCRKRRAHLRTDDLGVASTVVFAGMLVVAIISALLFASRSEALFYAGLFFVVLLLANAVIEGIIIYQSSGPDDLDAAVACGGSDLLAPTAVLTLWIGAIVYRGSEGHLGWTVFAIGAFIVVVGGLRFLLRRLEARTDLPVRDTYVPPLYGPRVAGQKKREPPGKDG